jgi:hypothetical protein
MRVVLLACLWLFVGQGLAQTSQTTTAQESPEQKATKQKATDDQKAADAKKAADDAAAKQKATDTKTPPPVVLTAAEIVPTMLVTLLVLIVVTYVLSWTRVPNVPKGLAAILFVGQDGKLSNSKTQMSLWFGLVVVTYVSLYYLRWAHGNVLGAIGIPTNVIALTGLSGLTFAGAKAITTNKLSDPATVATAQAAAGAKAAAVATAANQTPAQVADAQSKAAAVLPKQGQTASLSDLVRADDGKFDFGDYQMIIITLIAVTTYLIVCYNFLSSLDLHPTTLLPDVDGTVLALFGVGQGSYLAKKATGGLNQ